MARTEHLPTFISLVYHYPRRVHRSHNKYFVMEINVNSGRPLAGPGRREDPSGSTVVRHRPSHQLDGWLGFHTV